MVSLSVYKNTAIKDNITQLHEVIVLQDIVYRIISIQQALSLTPPGHKAHILNAWDSPIIRLVLGVSFESLQS